MKASETVSYQDRVAEIKESNRKAMKKLCIAAGVSVFFIAAQLVGGYLANSIAIFADSAHLASDMFGFGISMAALKLA